MADVSNRTHLALLTLGWPVLLQGKRVADVSNRMHVALPKPRDGVARPPVIPASVLAAQAGQPRAAPPRKLQKDIQVPLPSSCTALWKVPAAVTGQQACLWDSHFIQCGHHCAHVMP